MMEGSTEMAFKHCSEGEAKVAKKLVDAIFARGLTICHNDGADWTGEYKEKQRGALLEEMCMTGEDYLHLVMGGKSIGVIWLLYGNDEGGEELIADYSDTDEVRAIVEEVEAK